MTGRAGGGRQTRGGAEEFVAAYTRDADVEGVGWPPIWVAVEPDLTWQRVSELMLHPVAQASQPLRAPSGQVGAGGSDERGHGQRTWPPPPGGGRP
jgi:hypothetical protein